MTFITQNFQPVNFHNLLGCERKLPVTIGEIDDNITNLDRDTGDSFTHVHEFPNIPQNKEEKQDIATFEKYFRWSIVLNKSWI